jgi:ABC-type tungstate transport system substrate-binding protein
LWESAYHEIDRQKRSFHSSRMTRPLRALASLLVGITTVVGMMVYQHYSREPPTDIFTAALTMAATILAWVVTGLE